MDKRIAPFKDGLKIFDLIGERASELSDDDLGIIGGAIKEFKPKKILELGVSAGGTSCFIMQTLQILNLDSKVWSVDLAYTAHRNRERKCGYQIEQAKDYLTNYTNHQLMLGVTIPEVIEDIVRDDQKIDLVIMDTTHYLPGELLDFLIIFPYLSKNAAIIFDDMFFAFLGESTNAFATQLARDIIVADKLYVSDLCKEKMVGILLNNDTIKYIDSVFCALWIPWTYSLGEHEKAYSSIIEKNYDNKLNDIYKNAVLINKKMLLNKQAIPFILKELLNKVRSQKVFIYGAGQRGTALKKFLNINNIEIQGFIVSDDRDYNLLDAKDKLYKLSEVKLIDDKLIIVAAAAQEIRANLRKEGISFIDTPNYIYPILKEIKEIF